MLWRSVLVLAAGVDSIHLRFHHFSTFKLTVIDLKLSIFQIMFTMCAHLAKPRKVFLLPNPFLYQLNKSGTFYFYLIGIFTNVTFEAHHVVR